MFVQMCSSNLLVPTLLITCRRLLTHVMARVLYTQ